jgi:hypothetical protein
MTRAARHSVRPERPVIKWRTGLQDRGKTLKACIANEAERAKYRDASQEVKASDDIVLVYLVELDLPSVGSQ